MLNVLRRARRCGSARCTTSSCRRWVCCRSSSRGSAQRSPTRSSPSPSSRTRSSSARASRATTFSSSLRRALLPCLASLWLDFTWLDYYRGSRELIRVVDVDGWCEHACRARRRSRNRQRLTSRPSTWARSARPTTSVRQCPVLFSVQCSLVEWSAWRVWGEWADQVRVPLRTACRWDRAYHEPAACGDGDGADGAQVRAPGPQALRARARALLRAAQTQRAEVPESHQARIGASNASNVNVTWLTLRYTHLWLWVSAFASSRCVWLVPSCPCAAHFPPADCSLCSITLCGHLIKRPIAARRDNTL